MADNDDTTPEQPEPTEIIPSAELRPTDVVIHVEFGEAFAPSERLENALEELAASISEMEDAEVAGFQMDRLEMGIIRSPLGNPIGMEAYSLSLCEGGWKVCVSNRCSGDGSFTINKNKAFDAL